MSFFPNHCANAAEPCWQEWMPSLLRCALAAVLSVPHSGEASRKWMVSGCWPATLLADLGAVSIAAA